MCDEVSLTTNMEHEIVCRLFQIQYYVRMYCEAKIPDEHTV